MFWFFRRFIFAADETAARDQEYKREDQNADDVILDRPAPV